MTKTKDLDTQKAIDAYERKKEWARNKAREIALKTQEISPLPEVVNPRRRKKAFKSFKFFCETYFKEAFYLGWSQIHLNVIEKIERVVRNGEIFALAMPRGSGKTTLSQLAVLWAAMTGQTDFVVLIAANATRADSLLEDLKVWLETNDLLLEDFPEVCYPIRRLERISQRQRGQVLNGEPTRINWKASVMVLPTIAGSPSSGCCVTTAGMNGADIRGLSHTKADGKKIRPSLVFIDDPQTRESASSETQCDERERIIKADILGMAGPGKKLACCIATTVVCENDVAQRLLDRSRNPEFRGERYQLLDAMPTNTALWDEYRKIRESELQNDGDGQVATQFYKDHQADMDAGAIPTWPARYNDGELSAIQYAMNLKFRDEAAFLSEYQNSPVVEAQSGESFDPRNIDGIVSGLPRGSIPETAQFLTAFVDVHKSLLYWTLCAWDREFNGVVVDYGTFPKQNRSYFQAVDASPNLTTVYPTKTLETAIYNGLTETLGGLFSQTYLREDFGEVELQRVLIDANWSEMTDLVYQYIAESPFKSRITPSHGVGVGASSKPFSEYSRKPGDFIGPHWRIPNEPNRRALRRCLIDTNYWKSFILQRLASGPGDVGRLAVNGAKNEHQLLANHLAAEYCIPTEARGRRVDEWKQRATRQDNHWFDCLVGSAVAASIVGARLPDGQKASITPRRRGGCAFNKFRNYANALQR